MQKELHPQPSTSRNHDRREALMINPGASWVLATHCAITQCRDVYMCERETERDRDTSHATELESAFLVW